MQIRNKLTYQFVGIVASFLLVAFVTIYVLFAKFRKDEFYLRLGQKAADTGNLLLEVKKADSLLLKSFEKDLLSIMRLEKVVILDSNNVVIFRSDDNEDIIVNNQLLDEIRLEGKVEFNQNEYEVVALTYTSKDIPYTIIAAGKDLFGLRKLRFLGITLISVYLASLILVYFTGWLYAGRALQPISDVIRDVGNISVTNLNARVEEGNGKDEISHLSQTFNKMLGRIESAFKVQRAFVANASHELRNPLSVIRGQLEVTLLKDRQKEDYRKTMVSVLEDINHLTIISNRLLSLAQVSGAGIVDPKAVVRVDDLLLEVRDELLGNVPQYNVNISFESLFENEDLLKIMGNERLLKIAFFNLMENACKYSNDHSCTVDIGTSSNNIIVNFKDKGLGIPEADLKNIFEPFYRGKNVLDRKGHGIGLSLVEKIISLHGGLIEIISKENDGTSFIVKLPVSGV